MGISWGRGLFSTVPCGKLSSIPPDVLLWYCGLKNFHEPLLWYHYGNVAQIGPWAGVGCVALFVVLLAQYLVAASHFQLTLSLGWQLASPYLLNLAQYLVAPALGPRRLLRAVASRMATHPHGSPLLPVALLASAFSPSARICRTLP